MATTTKFGENKILNKVRFYGSRTYCVLYATIIIGVEREFVHTVDSH
ncbi:MAG: hypothetical protein ACI90V_013154 [Bacillariaceae sp.]|jgi:hypothetical protein